MGGVVKQQLSILLEKGIKNIVENQNIHILFFIFSMNAYNQQGSYKKKKCCAISLHNVENLYIETHAYLKHFSY